MSPASPAVHASSTGISHTSCGPADSKSGVLCIHGWGCQASDYAPLQATLISRAPELRTIAVDLPGHGKTPKELCPVATISAFAEVTLSLIDELGVASVTLVGHSMGCRVVLDAWAQAQAAGKPAVNGLVFLDGSHYKLRPSLFAFDTNDARSQGMTDEEKAVKKTEMFQRMFSARTPLEFQASALTHIKALDKEYSNAIRESHISYDYLQMDDALARFGKSGTPMLNLQSTDVDVENQRFPLKAGEMSKWMRFIEDKVPHAQQPVVEDSAHFPHVDCP
ncbi:hypothetical protein LTR85_009725 [Meristemomyces frigidus]|nr:hypothetical protein LTR85_009725 [Meristemomyces frigidus]